MSNDLLTKINYYQEKLNELADQKENPLNDQEIYEISCILDELIVEFMKTKKTTK